METLRRGGICFEFYSSRGALVDFWAKMGVSPSSRSVYQGLDLSTVRPTVLPLPETFNQMAHVGSLVKAEGPITDFFDRMAATFIWDLPEYKALGREMARIAELERQASPSRTLELSGLVFTPPEETRFVHRPANATFLKLLRMAPR